MALISTLAPDPGADLAAQAQLMRQQKLAQLLATPAPAPEIDMGGDGGGGGKGNSPEGNSILAKMLSEDVGRTAGPSVANFDAPVSAGSGPALSIGNPGSAFPIISHFEGFRSKPYWDVNHYRVGYGSDTITGPDGRVVEVKPGMSVTKDDAARDLSRRIGEFQGGIQNDIGKEAWERLPDSTKAALTSVAYNYGAGWGRKIPSLLSAARAGDVNAISAAIASRAGDNHGVNAKRRQMEAEIAAGRAMPTGPVPAADEAPYKVASLGFQPPPRRQPIAPFPTQQPNPAPDPTTPYPPIMATAPAPVEATPIQPQGGAALTSAPMPPSRSANGVDDMIRRQAASARPSLTQPEEGDLFDEIGRGLEELFGGGGADTGGQSQGVQVAGGGEQYYPMQPGTGHGILGLLSDALREPVPIPAEVQALARSPRQSDRLAYHLMVHGNELGGTQSALMTAMYKEARDREQAAENRYAPPQTDQYGNYYQMGPNGEYRLIKAAEKPQARQTTTVEGVVIDTQTGQPIYTAPQKPQAPISVGEGTTLFDPVTRQPIYTAPKTNNTQSDPYASTRAKSRAEMDALEENADRLGLQGDERRQFLISGGKSTMQDEKVTAEQGNAAGFATRMREADKIISDPAAVAETKGAKGAGQSIAGSLPVVGNFLVSDNYQRLDQAQRDFINATLRRESGASISPSEFENARKQYFPQPGDSDVVLSQKARNRQTAMEGIAAGGAPNFRQSFFGDRNPDIVKRANERSNTNSAGQGGANINPRAIEFLRSNPETAEQFDAKYGRGSAARVLGR